MFLNLCHSLGIMLLVKANPAYSAIPFSVSGNILESNYLFIRIYVVNECSLISFSTEKVGISLGSGV